MLVGPGSVGPEVMHVMPPTPEAIKDGEAYEVRLQDNNRSMYIRSRERDTEAR